MNVDISEIDQNNLNILCNLNHLNNADNSNNSNNLNLFGLKQEEVKSRINALSSTFSDPIHRRASISNMTSGTNLPSNPELLMEQMSKWFQYIGFLEYLECRERWSKCLGVIKGGILEKCTTNHPCVGLTNDMEVRRNMTEQWTRRLNAFAIPNPDSISPGRFFACHACGIELTQYDVNRLPCDQSLMTFRFLWHNPDTCRTPFNAMALVCQACYYLYQICDYNQNSFCRLIKQLFRPLPYENIFIARTCSNSNGNYDRHLDNQSCFLNPENRLAYENRIDILHQTLGCKKQQYQDLDTLKVTWAMQLGLVVYPFPNNNNNDLSENHQFHSDQFHQVENIFKGREYSTQNASFKHILSQTSWSETNQKDMNLNSADLHDKTHEKTQQSQQEKSHFLNNKSDKNIKRDLLKRQKIDVKIQQQFELQKWARIACLNSISTSTNRSYVQFWIPIDPNPSSRSLFARAQTNRSSSNYCLTIQALHQIESIFEYREFFSWLLNVCYWNLNKQEIQREFDLFRICRFRPYVKEENDSLQKRWYEQYAHMPLNALQLPPFLNLTKTNQKIPCVDYSDNNHFQNLELYLKSEIEKLAGHLSVLDQLELHQACHNILIYLQRKSQEIEFKSSLIEYYNSQIYPLVKQLKQLKQSKQASNKKIQPVLTGLQRYQQFDVLLRGTSLEAENGFRVNKVSKFIDLNVQEQVEYVQMCCPSLNTIPNSSIENVLKDIRQSKILEAALGNFKSYSQQLHICSPLYKQVEEQMPKRCRFVENNSKDEEMNDLSDLRHLKDSKDFESNKSNQNTKVKRKVKFKITNSQWLQNMM